MQMIIWVLFLSIFPVAVRINRRWYSYLGCFGLGRLFVTHSYTLSFLEELVQKLGNLFVAPLRPVELIAGLATISMMRTLIGMIPAALLAIPFLMFPFLIWVCRCWDSFSTWFLRDGNFSTGYGILIRYGLGAESLTWFCRF